MPTDDDNVWESPEQEERFRFGFEHPGFEGNVEFDAHFEVLGKTFTRRLRADYRYTPEWEYFDLTKKTLYTGTESSGVGLSVLAVPEPWSDPLTEEEIAAGEEPEEVDPPTWLGSEDLVAEGVLPRAVWDALYELIDREARKEDAKRRAQFL